MKTSILLIVVTAAIGFVIPGADAAMTQAHGSGCSALLVAQAMNQLTYVVASQKLGTASTVELLYVQNYLLDTQLCAGVIDKSLYCLDKTANLEKLLQIREKMFQVGIVFRADVEQTTRERDALKQTCAE